jgi:hypothetical protein
MPPKTSKKNAESGDEDNISLSSIMDMLKGMSGQITSLNQKMEKMDSIESEVKSLKVLITDLKNENQQLKSEAKVTDRKLSEMNQKNCALENRIINLEQYNRSWSARALNIPLTSEEEANNYIVADKVYKLLLLPILQGAVEREILPSVPTVDQLLELAHVLPGKPCQPKPIIMRFLNRNVKDIIFNLKKFYAPREEGLRVGAGASRGGSRGPARAGEGEEGGGFEGRGKYKYPLYEDLSRPTFLKMRAISKDERVKACWSTKGQIKFVLHQSPSEIRKVVSILDTLEDIIK